MRRRRQEKTDLESIDKKLQSSSIDKKFVTRMIKIVDVLPIYDFIKLQLKSDINTYQKKLVGFLEFQTMNVEDQEPINEWYEILFPLASKIYDDIETEERKIIYKKSIGKNDFGRKRRIK